MLRAISFFSWGIKLKANKPDINIPTVNVADNMVIILKCQRVYGFFFGSLFRQSGGHDLENVQHMHIMAKNTKNRTIMTK